MPIMSFAEDIADITSPLVAELIAQKRAKMQKLSKCKGSTKNLKIAGLSTLGVTAVGVVANVAEAVILKEEQGKLNKATSEAVESLCKSEKGLNGEWDSIDKICTVKEELFYKLPAGITCNIARTECSSGNIKVKIRVKIEPVAPIEYEVPVKEEPAEEAPGGGTSGGDGSGEGASGGDVVDGEVSGGETAKEEAVSAQADEVPAEEVAPTQSEKVSPEDNKLVPEIKKTPRQKIKQDKRSNKSIKSAIMYAETSTCNIYNANTDTLGVDRDKCKNMSIGSWVVTKYNGEPDTGQANCNMTSTCYCKKDSTGWEQVDSDFKSYEECANECAFMCVMYWYNDD